MRAEMITLPGGHVVVALSGEIDIVAAPAVRQALAAATRKAVAGVIADLAEVTFMDAAGLRELPAPPTAPGTCRTGSAGPGSTRSGMTMTRSPPGGGLSELSSMPLMRWASPCMPSTKPRRRSLRLPMPGRSPMR